MEEDLIDFHHKSLKTDSFSKLQTRPEVAGKNAEVLQLQYNFTGGKSDLYSSSMTSMEEYQRYLSELEDLKKEIGTLELSPPSARGGMDSFITPKPIDLSTDPPRDSGYRSYEGSYPGGGGSLLVTRPGSLTVTRPTRVEGARQKFGVVATGRQDLPEARAVHRGSAEGEVVVASIQTTPGIYSGHGRQ